MNNQSVQLLKTTFLIILTLSFAATAFAQTQNEAQTLQPNQILEREMTGEETHPYKFDLKANEFFQVYVEQKGVDVALKLISSKGEILATMDSPNGKEGPEILLFVAGKPDSFVLEVSGLDAKAEKGLYTIKREIPRAATADDKRKVSIQSEARAILNEALALYNQKTAESYKIALSKFIQASRLYFEIDDKLNAILPLSLGGEISDYLGDKITALELFEKALPLLQNLKEKRSEAIILSNIGAVYDSLGEKQKALEYYNRSLSIAQLLGDKSQEAKTLNNIGTAYDSLGEKQKALDYLNQSLPLSRQISDKPQEAATLNNIGAIYASLGENQKALDYYNQSLPLSRQVGNKSFEARMLNNIGAIYANSGENEKALDYLSQSLPISRQTGDKSQEAKTLNNIGKIYDSLGEKQKALDYFNQSLPLSRQISDKPQEAGTLNNIGLVYDSLGEKQKALDYFNQSLPLSRQTGDKSLEAGTLNNIGLVYDSLGEKQEAFDYYNQSLPLSRQVGNKSFEARTLNNIGAIYANSGENEKALDYYNQSLSLSRQIGDKSLEANMLGQLMVSWNNLNNQRRSSLYGKQSVNLYQQLRSNINGLDKSIQQTYLKSVEGTYRYLADILIADSRLPEAQAVLNLLKENEYAQLSRSGESGDTIPYSQAEAEVIAKIDNLVALGRERGELQRIQKQTRTLSDEQMKTMARLDSEIEAANKFFDAALVALGKAEQSSQARVDEIANGKELQGALTRLAAKTKSGVVALYTVLGTDETGEGQNAARKNESKFGWVIMVTADGYKAYPIDVANLEATVFQFRNALLNDRYDPQQLAEKIYTAIFRQTSSRQKRTLEQDLQDYLKLSKDKTLMWSLDGVLRYIPMAALHDGKNYLVKNYRNVIFTKNSFVSLAEENQENWNALGLGISEERENFNALPGVKTELETIIRERGKSRGILNGKIELDANFQKQRFFAEVRGGAYPVVHIASHYSFNSTKLEDSFLLLGDGHLTFSELKDKLNLFGTVDLLTLSACDTGVSGNGKETEGFAYLAQSLGAKSVIASLWQVSDAGTPELMIRFYKLRAEHPEMPKGEAFRLAQSSMIDGSTTKENKAKNNKTNRAEIVGGSDEMKLPLFVKDAQNPFAHPHYWASFVLIGNWR